MPEKVTIVGTGYVGLVTGVCLARSGHDVTCIDIDPAKVAALAAGRPTIYEPGIAEMLAEGLARGTLRFATPEDGWRDLISDITFIAVGTPMAENGAADLSHVRTVVEALCAAADRPFTLVMKSTVPPGTGTVLKERFLCDAGCEISYVSNPEFLREGHALSDWFTTDRSVLGADDEPAIAVMRPLRRHRHPGGGHRRGERGDHQVREQRVPLHQDFLHQRDRQRLRRGGRRRGRRVPRRGARLAHRRAVPARRHRLRGQLLSQGHPGARLHLHAERLPVHAAQVGHRGQQPPEDPARHPPRTRPARPARLNRGGPRPGLQARYRRHARGTRARHHPAPARGGRDGDRLRPARGPGGTRRGRNCLDRVAVEGAGLTYMAVGRPGAHRAQYRG